MSVSSEKTVWRGGEGCVEWVQVPARSAARARERVAKDSEWTRRGRKDMCPACTKKAQKDATP